MTVAGLIEQYNTERPNNVDDAHKVQWIKKIEQMIINEVILTHEHNPMDEIGLQLQVSGSTLHIERGGTLSQHMDKFDLDTELIVPEPYDDIYMYFIDQRIALNQNDTRRFNSAAAMYNNALLQYQQFYNRTYDSIRASKKPFNHSRL